MNGTGKYRTKRRITEKFAVCTEEGGKFPSFFVARHAIKQSRGMFWAHWYPPGYQYLHVRGRKGVHMVDLFADVPEEMIENTLQTIRRNLDRVGLYGGHTLRKHTDIQLLALKTRLTKEDIRYATSYWDVEVANAVVSGIMHQFFDSSITAWLKYSGSDWISLVGQFPRTVGYGFRKGEEKLEENLRKACLVLVKDADTDWGFRILTSYPIFERQERQRG